MNARLSVGIESNCTAPLRLERMEGVDVEFTARDLDV